MPTRAYMRVIVAVCLGLWTVSVNAQTSPVDAYLQLNSDANLKYGAGQWTEAIPVLEKLVKANPLDGDSWVRLATATYNAKDYRRSIDAYEKQLALGSGIPANAAYNIACNYALLGDKESAITWLQKAFKMGFASLPGAQQDTDLQSLRDDRRYTELVGLVNTTGMSRDEGWRSDLRLLVREIKRKGYNLFPRTQTEADFDAAVAKLNDSIPKLTDVQVIVELMKLMHRVGDGHSGLLGGNRSEFSANLPVQFYLFEEGLFIISADPKYKDLVGSQVIKFGNHTPEEIIAGLEPVISRDNDHWIKQIAPYRMRNLNVLSGLGLVSETDKVALTVRGLDGNNRTATLVTDTTQPDIWNILPNPPTWVNLSQIVPGPTPLYMKDPGKAYWFQYLPDKKVMYFGYNSIRNDREESFSAFTSRLFKFISENDVEKLVIDLRWNNGGNTFLVRPLIQGIIENPKINTRGKLFVIIGRRTFSAAQNAATFLDRHTNAIFVGEPTGSGPNFVGEESPFTLPYSKIVMNVSDLYWESSFPQDKRIWISPQIYIPPTFAAYRANRDLVLEAILSSK